MNPTCRFPVATLVVAAALLPAHLAAQATRAPLARESFAITNATVIPMSGDTVLRDATILVRDGRIAAVGPSRRVNVPRGVRRIDGRGRYVIPGLHDMHTHLYSDGEVPDSSAPHELGVMVANGVTTARLLMGTGPQLELRRAVMEGRVAGPQLWLASPGFTMQQNADTTLSRIVRTPEAARAAVREVASAGFDFIKMLPALTAELYDAITDEARQVGIRTTGHVDLRAGVPRALAAGQQNEHLDGYLEMLLVDSLIGRPSLSGYGVFVPRNWETMDHVDEARIGVLARQTAEANVWVTPTLVVFNRAFAQRQTLDEIRRRPDWLLMPPQFRTLYLNALRSYWNHPQGAQRTDARRARYVELRGRLTKAISDAGGRIMAGSDSPEWFFAYGFALHYELVALVEAGLTPWQALAAATRTPAEYLGGLAEWGTIEPGKRADLVVLTADPLVDIRNTQRIQQVVLGGRVLERAALDTLIAVGSRAINGAPPDSLPPLR